MSRDTVSLRQQRLEEDYSGEQLAEARRLAYEDSGHFVVDHCDVLIALCDGQPPRGRGGTANIMTYARESKCPLYVINTNNPAMVERPNEITLPTDLIDHLSRFNSRLASWEDRTGYVANQYEALFENNEGEKLPDGVKDTVRERLLPFYAVASVAAKKAQKIYQKVGLWSFILALVASATIAVGIIFLPGGSFHLPSGPIFALELLILITILALIFWANRIRAHKSWMEYRFLAERIRSASFMTSAGMETNATSFRRREETGSSAPDWTVVAFEEIRYRLPRQDTGKLGSVMDVAAFIRKRWLMDQLDFHRNKARSCKEDHHRREHWGEGIFFAAIAMAVLHLTLAALWHPLVGTSAFHLACIVEQSLTWLSLILPAIAATLEGLRSHREDRRIAMQSEKMIIKLTALEKEFRLVNEKNLPRLLRKTEQLMLEENSEWLLFVSAAELNKVV